MREIQDFTVSRRVGFGDCAQAQVDFGLEALDAFWEAILDGEGWFTMNAERDYGMPFVLLEHDFHSPIRCGGVRPVSISTTSVRMEVQGEQNGRLCFTARSVSVFLNQGSNTKMPVSGHIREALVQRLSIHQ